MRTFKTSAAQGDVLLRRIKAIPEGATRVDAEGRIVLAHSETGHHHAIYADKLEAGRFEVGDPLVCYLQVSADYVDLLHERDHHRHDTLRISRGVYEVRRAREWNPWTRSDRRVED